MSKKDAIRVVSFLNDTADQQNKLNELEKDAIIAQEANTPKVKEKNPKAKLSDWGLLHFKLQAMLLGKIVLSDSFIWNNFFLHELSNDEFNSFLEFVSNNQVIEVRCRPERNKEGKIIPSLFEKAPNIRNYWSPALQNRISEARVILEKEWYKDYSDPSKRILKADDYFNVVDEVCGSDFFNGVSDFALFKERISRYDTLRNVLENKNLIEMWKDDVNDRLWRERRFKLIELVDKMWGKTEFECLELENMNGGKYNFDAAAKLKEHIISCNRYDGKVVEDLCDALGADEKGKERAERFFFHFFHKDIFCRGVTLQHEGHFMQTREVLPPTKEVRLIIPPKGREDLCNLTWSNLSKVYSSNDFQDKQANLTRDIRDPDKGPAMKESLFKEMLTLAGIDCDHPDILETSNNIESDPVAASSSSQKATKLYIADAEKELEGAISIEIK